MELTSRRYVIHVTMMAILRAAAQEEEEAGEVWATPRQRRMNCVLSALIQE